MGIQQLLPFLSKCTERVNISDFEGWTVAVDAYCWLHKGSYACSEELLLGTPTDKYVQYCLKFVNMLIKHKIKPVMVFDGQKLQAKSSVELQRQEKRRSASIAARRLLLDGNRAEAKRYLGQSISITGKMAHDVIEACRAIGVDCIVAQYEADAQLAYLSLSNIVHLVISEDSDLLVFGCRRVLFKLDLSGRGEMIQQDRLGEVLGADFSFEKFRYMCMFSGCDYLEGIDGVGLNKAMRIFKRAKQSDIKRIIANLSGYLGRPVRLKPGYTDSFLRANNTFLYQIVFDPIQRRVCSLNHRPSNLSAEDFPYAGKELEPELALNLSLGNLDPSALKPFEGSTLWHPDNNPKSIWSSFYELPKTPMKRSLAQVSSRFSALAYISKQHIVNLSSDNPRKRKIADGQNTIQKDVLQCYENGGRLRATDSVELGSASIVVEDSDPEGDVTDAGISCSTLSSSSPTIVSQTSRLIRRSIASTSTEAAANKFFGITTSMQMTYSNESAVISPYFQSQTTKRLKQDEEQPEDESFCVLPLANRLASKRLMLQGAGAICETTKTEVSPSPCEIVKAEENGSAVDELQELENVPSKENDVIFIADEEPSDQATLTSSKGDDIVVPESLQAEEKEQTLTKTVPSAGNRGGGAIRLLLEKFSYKAAESQ